MKQVNEYDIFPISNKSESNKIVNHRFMNTRKKEIIRRDEMK